MRLPFTHDQFLAAFGSYNTTLWPVVLGLWVSSVFALGRFLSGRPASRLLSVILVGSWLWGAMYHFVYFAPINPAARIFGALFVIEAALLTWSGLIRSTLDFTPGRAPRHRIGTALFAYSLLYPGLALAAGLHWPDLPTFGVPCPTTLMTVGLLLTVSSSGIRWVSVIPFLWTVIGGSAALLLGVLPDLALPVAGVLLLLHLTFPRTLSGGGAGG
jgi:uncharacterized protein DUF6064